ncbi:neurotactin isoform X3 [Thrips palmi]|uniref:Neurotactin isoform X3 n=1 Tax=Thrips palmi TaxID=161013 RepID=A0A6P8ZD12_THRPL|nr:neurotactin isoform X3 [Thrips palmi]
MVAAKEEAAMSSMELEPKTEDKLDKPEKAAEKVEKTDDKKEIEEEEREMMLNEENKKHTEEANEKAKEAGEDTIEAADAKVSTGEVERKRKALEEATKKDDKGRVPIGGIRMPGFLQRRGKDKGKEPDPEEGVDLLEQGGAAADKAAEGAEGAREGFGPRCQRSLRRLMPNMPKGVPNLPAMPAMPALRPHLASLKLANPFSKKKKATDVEAGPTVTSEEGAAQETTPVQEAADKEALAEKEKHLQKAKEAGLEVVEVVKSKNKEDEADAADGMETVQLDAEEKGDPDKDAAAANKNLPLMERVRAYPHKLVVAGVAVFVVLLITIISVAVSGPRHDFARGPIPDGNGKFALATTSCGLVQGLLESGAYTFRGIPFARPPVGQLRWKPAQPLDNLEHCWNGTFTAHNASNFCWQIFPEDQSVNGAEDCLTLDVYTPQVSFENPLPVVVVVGSSHMTGGSTTPLLQPTAKLSRAKEVVFVRPNFRLGVLGFLSTKSLSRSAYPQTSGNYGLSDIKMALEWVKLNIAAFGGDPNAVTVLGYRAGATLVTALASSPSSKGLMKRVWVTSGSADFPGRPLSESENDAAPFLEKLRGQCNNKNSTADEVSAECLRSIDVEDLLDAMPAEWRPTTPDLPAPVSTNGMPSPHQWLVLDGDLLRNHPSEVWEKWETEGTGALQIVIGATAHSDASVELYRNVSDGAEKDVRSHIENSVLGEAKVAEDAINRYNATWSGLASLVSDIRTVCPLNAMATKMPTSAYFYVATFPISVSKSEDELEYQEPLAELGIDVAAIMGRVEGATPEERRYITAMQQLFYQFVRFGELHHGSERYSGRVLVVDQDTLPKNEYPNCNFWIQKDIVPRFGHRN